MSKQICCQPRLLPRETLFRCDIQQNTAAEQEEAIWLTVVPGVRCVRIDAGGGERVRCRELSSTTNSVVRINYRRGVIDLPSLKPGENRLLFEDKALNIIDVKNRSGHPKGFVTIDCRFDGDRSP